MTLRDAFLFGLLGGGAIEFIEVKRVHARPKRERKRYFSDRSYWVVRFGSALFGGGIAVAYAAVPAINLNAILAVTVGAAWPSIIGALSDTGPLPMTKTD